MPDTEGPFKLSDTHHTTYEVARIFDVTTYTVRRWIKAGVFKDVIKYDGYHRIPKSEVTRVAQEKYGDASSPILGL